MKKKRCWKTRKRGYTIGRLIWVSPTTRELYYMRMLLTVKKYPMSYDDLKPVEGLNITLLEKHALKCGFYKTTKSLLRQ